MRKQISPEVSLHTEFRGLIGIRDDRNGNLVMLSLPEARAVIAGMEELIDESEMAIGLNLTPPENDS